MNISRRIRAKRFNSACLDARRLHRVTQVEQMSLLAGSRLGAKHCRFSRQPVWSPCCPAVTGCLTQVATHPSQSLRRSSSLEICHKTLQIRCKLPYSCQRFMCYRTVCGLTRSMRWNPQNLRQIATNRRQNIAFIRYQ